MKSLTQQLTIEIRNSYKANKLWNRTTTYSNAQEETGMLLSSAFKATAYKGSKRENWQSNVGRDENLCERTIVPPLAVFFTYS